MDKSTATSVPSFSLSLTEWLGTYSLSQCLDELCERLNIKGIFFIYHEFGLSDLDENASTVASTSLQPCKQELQKLALSQQHQQGIIQLNSERLSYICHNTQYNKTLSAKVYYLLDQPNTPHLPLELATALIGMVAVAKQKNQFLEGIQDQLRYQAVWAECSEWLKKLEEADDKFFHELLKRSALMVRAKKALVLKVKELNQTNNNNIEYYPWDMRGITQEAAQEIIAFCENNSLLDWNKISVHDLKQYKPNQLANMKSLMTVPITINDIHVAMLLLMEPADHFVVLDEVYIKQIISQARTNIERQQLFKALQATNEQLNKEKNEQLNLIDKLQNTQKQLVHSEKMASIGQLAAGVAHEINNPVGYVSSNLISLKRYIQDLLQIIKECETQITQHCDDNMRSMFIKLADDFDLEFLKEDIMQLLEESAEGLDRVKVIVQDLKDFSHVSEAEMDLADINHLLNKTLNILHNELKYKCKIIKEFSDLPNVECVSSQVNQIFMNLLVNAGHAIEKNGLITIKTWPCDDVVKISISDNGHGIKEEHLEKLFDPFFTTKPVGKGTGLGLSISYGIIQKHHGEIEVESKVGEGTTFTVALPIKQPATGNKDAQ